MDFFEEDRVTDFDHGKAHDANLQTDGFGQVGFSATDGSGDYDVLSGIDSCRGGQWHDVFFHKTSRLIVFDS
jgi:hypothetical protein